MKKKDVQSIGQSDTQELYKQAAELRHELAVSLVNRYTKPVKNVRANKLQRQKLSRILTAIREKENAHVA